MSDRERFKKSVGKEVREQAPQFSVVIPAYNSAATIRDSLESVFAQTFNDFEVILVNDGSPDQIDLENQIHSFADRIVYITQPNSGAGAARNAGIVNARGTLIAFLDGDDIWYPTYLAEQLAFMNNFGFDMAYCDADMFGRPSVEGRTYMEVSPSEGAVNVESMLDLRCNVITSGTVVAKDVLVRAGMFEVARTLSEDFHLWVRLAAAGARIGYQRRVLLKYRVTSDGLSGNTVNRVRRAIDVFGRLKALGILTPSQIAIIERRLSGFEADLAVEEGKAALIARRYTDSASAFKRANRLRPSAKMTAVSLLANFAPGALGRLFRSTNELELDLIARPKA